MIKFKSKFKISLEGLNGGLNLFINLVLNKQLAETREKGAHKCGDCHKEFNKNDLLVKNNNVYWPANYPVSGVCDNVNFYHLIIIF